MLDLTGSRADLGCVLAARTVPMVAFMLVGGIWADRLPRHHVMLGANRATVEVLFVREVRGLRRREPVVLHEPVAEGIA